MTLSGAGLAEDLRFELAILATVQGFYQKLMRDALGGDVPIPSGLDEDALRHSDRELPTFNQNGFQAGEIAIVWGNSPSIACRIALT